MFFKCLLFLFVLGGISAPEPRWTEASRIVRDSRASRPCPFPRFEHGRFRMRQKSKLIKFVCFPGYELAGNKYATCRDGEWDVPLPVCVKPGCPLPAVQNGLPIVTHGGAWVVFFCYPRHTLVGSPAIYCDGRKWNASVPICVDSTVQSRLSCDFEDTNLCGWTNDDYHDFDWKRYNKRTPSSFLFTGPSHDHTLGSNGNGYYMYIESTSRLENDTARLISPLYDATVAKNGCFSFYYHMYGKTTGGLRVYQKPEKLALQDMLRLTGSEMQQYLLFEKWGNQGDTWYRGVETLNDFNEDFQIVIEGIRGTSFTSDIAIDDVAILQGEDCAAAKQTVVTPSVSMPDSCQGRCDVYGVQATELGCGCTASCVAEGNCCPDFFDVCVFDPVTTPEENSPNELPQTQKLVAPTVTVAAQASTTTTTTSTTTPKPTTTQKPTKATTLPPPSTKIIIPTTKAKITPTTTPKTTTQAKLTTRKVTFNTTEIVQLYNKTESYLKHITTSKPIRTTTKAIKKTTMKPTTAAVKTTTFSYKRSYLEDSAKAEQEKTMEHRRMAAFGKAPEASKSSVTKTAILTITGLLCFIGAAWLFVWSRSTRGRTSIARLRGRVTNDPDVRYLHAADDDME